MMKKMLLASALLCAALGAVSAQKGAVLLSALDLERYNSYFIDKATNALSSDYAMASTDTEWEKISPLGGDPTDVDTPLEIALLSTCAGVVDIRPAMPPEVEAILPKSNPRLSDLKLGAAVYMDLQAAKFLGSDPAPHAAALKFITDRGNVTEADIRDFVKQGIAAAVQEKFNEIYFRLEKYQKSYAATLSIDPKTSEYILNYGVYDNNEKKISGHNLEALLIVMKSNTDFDARSIEQTRNQAALIPAVVYSSWVEKKMTKIDAVQLAADTVANFYISPTNANYDLLVGVFGLFNRSGSVEDPVARAGLEAYRTAIIALNEQLGHKADRDGLNKGAVLARAARAQNPDYSIFTTPYTPGGGNSGSK
jgi:hypothetical protein